METNWNATPLGEKQITRLPIICMKCQMWSDGNGSRNAKWNVSNSKGDKIENRQNSTETGSRVQVKSFDR